MLKRLLVGFAKGGVVGLAIGAGFNLGLGVESAPGLLGYLIAMGIGATAGLLVGRPPWKQEAWLEASLKALVGLGIGALLFWLAERYVAVPLPFRIPGVSEGAPWNVLPILFGPAVGALYGAFVELDNTRPAAGPQAELRAKRSFSRGNQ